MEIKIKADTDVSGEETLVLTNDGFANDNFVTLVFGDVDADVSLDDLFAAVFAFVKIRDLNLEKEQRMV
jgi:hypothetical protein